MNPILHDPNESSFRHNGLGILSDATRCIVERELNGIYTLTLEYPANGIHVECIVDRSIICAPPDSFSEPQPFRVYGINAKGRNLTISARHLAHDLAGIPITPFVASTAAEAMASIRYHTAVPCLFSFETDKTTSARYDQRLPKAAWSVLGGSEGSLLDVYGGEYEFDGWIVRLRKKLGEDRGVSIRYGKNLATLEQDRQCADCYTGVYPYWASEDVLVTLPEGVFYAPGNYDYCKIMPLDLSDERSEPPTIQQLRAETLRYIQSHDIGVPDVSLKIEFVQARQSDVPIDVMRLGDTVSVNFPTLGVSATARIVQTVYNVLADRYDSIQVGRVKQGFVKAVAAMRKNLFDPLVLKNLAIAMKYIK